MVILNFESVGEILKCDHSNESYRAGLSYGAVNYALTIDSVTEILKCVLTLVIFAIMIILSLGEPRVITFFRVSPIHRGRFCISVRGVVPTFYLRVQYCVWILHRQKRMADYRAQSLVMFDFFKGETNF